jgi:hypothetical protein
MGSSMRIPPGHSGRAPGQGVKDECTTPSSALKPVPGSDRSFHDARPFLTVYYNRVQLHKDCVCRSEPRLCHQDELVGRQLGAYGSRHC